MHSAEHQQWSWILLSKSGSAQAQRRHLRLTTDIGDAGKYQGSSWCFTSDEVLVVNELCIEHKQVRLRNNLRKLKKDLCKTRVNNGGKTTRVKNGGKNDQSKDS